MLADSSFEFDSYSMHAEGLERDFRALKCEVILRRSTAISGDNNLSFPLVKNKVSTNLPLSTRPNFHLHGMLLYHSACGEIVDLIFSLNMSMS